MRAGLLVGALAMAVLALAACVKAPPAATHGAEGEQAGSGSTSEGTVSLNSEGRFVELRIEQPGAAPEPPRAPVPDRPVSTGAFCGEGPLLLGPPEPRLTLDRPPYAPELAVELRLDAAGWSGEGWRSAEEAEVRAVLARHRDEAVQLGALVGVGDARFRGRVNLAVAPEVPTAEVHRTLALLLQNDFVEVFFLAWSSSPPQVLAVADPAYAEQLADLAAMPDRQARLASVDAALAELTSSCPEPLPLQVLLASYPEIRCSMAATLLEVMGTECPGMDRARVATFFGAVVQPARLPTWFAVALEAEAGPGILVMPEAEGTWAEAHAWFLEHEGAAVALP